MNDVIIHSTNTRLIEAQARPDPHPGGKATRINPNAAHDPDHQNFPKPHSTRPTSQTHSSPAAQHQISHLPLPNLSHPPSAQPQPHDEARSRTANPLLACHAGPVFHHVQRPLYRLGNLVCTATYRRPAGAYGCRVSLLDVPRAALVIRYVICTARLGVRRGWTGVTSLGALGGMDGPAIL